MYRNISINKTEVDTIESYFVHESPHEMRTYHRFRDSSSTGRVCKSVEPTQEIGIWIQKGTGACPLT